MLSRIKDERCEVDRSRVTLKKINALSHKSEICVITILHFKCYPSNSIISSYMNIGVRLSLWDYLLSCCNSSFNEAYEEYLFKSRILYINLISVLIGNKKPIEPIFFKRRLVTWKDVRNSTKFFGDNVDFYCLKPRFKLRK